MKRFVTVFAIALAGILLWIFLFQTVAVMDNVYIEDFALSPDGQTMTIRVGVSVSVGYTRSVTVEETHKGLQLTFHPAYGFINGKIGAKNTFTIPLKPYYDKIYVMSSAYFSGGVLNGLIRDENGVWSIQNFSSTSTPGN